MKTRLFWKFVDNLAVYGLNISGGRYQRTANNIPCVVDGDFDPEVWWIGFRNVYDAYFAAWGEEHPDIKKYACHLEVRGLVY